MTGLGATAGVAGEAAPDGEAGLIVVAPYNAQEIGIQDALKEAGLEEIPVGTMDSFQGQEAPACLVSMTASSVDKSPSGMDFLLSLNRINVYILRAKALALVFGSPRLLKARYEMIQADAAGKHALRARVFQFAPPGEPYLVRDAHSRDIGAAGL